MLLLFSLPHNFMTVFIVKYKLSILLTHLVSSFVMRNSIDKKETILVVNQVFSIDYSYLSSILVVLGVFAIFIDFHLIAILVISDWIVVRIVF